MATAASFQAKYDLRGGQRVDPAAHQRVEPKPPTKETHSCPYCDQPIWEERSSLVSLFVGGMRRLDVAFRMLARSLIRLIRFALAAAFCLVGLIGACAREIGLKLVHPNDRRFLWPKSS